MEVVTHNKDQPMSGVLLIHSWWGLTDSFREYGKKLAQRGFVVGLADLFYGDTAKTISKAKRLRSGPRRNPMYKDLIADIEELQTYTIPRSQIAVVGFSMGGHWAVWLSQQRELPIKATVLYYAARAGSFKNSHSNFLAHFAESDEYVSDSSKRNMRNNIENAGLSYECYDYPNTRHWFAESARKKEYALKTANIAYERTVEHLKLNLG